MRIIKIIAVYLLFSPAGEIKNPRLNTLHATISNTDTIYTLTKTNVRQLITKLKIKFPEIVYKQIILETGNLKSYLCLCNHNLFGMRLPWRRKTLAISKRLGYAVYRSWVESIEDYKLWQDFVLKDSVFDYRGFLRQAKYSISASYTTKL